MIEVTFLSEKIIKKLSLIFVAFSYSVTALTNTYDDKKHLFVSLGSHCEPASYLREFQLRNIAFPFDWIVSFNHEGAVAILEDNFNFF